jgi:hypothetical protein
VSLDLRRPSALVPYIPPDRVENTCDFYHTMTFHSSSCDWLIFPWLLPLKFDVCLWDI